MNKIFLFLSIFYSFNGLKASECKPLSVYAIPGQNGLGSSSRYVRSMLGQNTNVIPVETPGFLTDLGQFFCQKHLEKALKENSDEGIIYATSQGTATALNYLAKNPTDKIKGVVLEATLASGNSAILHTATGPLMGMSWLRNIPGYYYLAPYVVAPFFGYRPAGQQPIKSVDNITNKEMPIIIVHSQNDPQLSLNDAKALYYRLKSNGNNVYFIESTEKVLGNWGKHLEILESSPNWEDVSIILSKNNVLPKTDYADQADFSKYQPESEQFKPQYDELIAKERNHTYFERILAFTACAGILYKWQQWSGFSFRNNLKFLYSPILSMFSARKSPLNS